MPSESCTAVDNFLQDVDEQISCKTGLDSVNRELRGHIEEKAELYMEYGVEEKEAYRRAVRDMGAPDVVGMELNKHHRLRTAVPLLAVILLLMAVGVAGEVLRDRIEWSLYDILYEISDKRYFLWGLLVLFLVTRFGYPFLLKHTKGICVLFLGICLFFGGLYVTVKLFPGWLDQLYMSQTLPGLVFWNLWRMFSGTFFVGIVQLAVPVGAVILYRWRNQYFRGFLVLFLMQVLVIFLGKGNYMETRTYVSVLLLCAGCLGTALYLSEKGWVSVSRERGILTALAGFGLLLILWAAPQWNQIRECWKICVNPGSRASVTNAWDDSYNNVLIRELLGKAEAFGEIRLTEEELTQYDTAEWYYEDGPGNWNGGETGDSDNVFDSLEGYVKNQMKDQENLSLRKILPQYYMENYRISWWVLRYGWVPALALTVLVLALPVMALLAAFRIRNHLGRTVAFSAGLIFAIQTVFYLIENFGFQFGYFINLPFVSEGIVSITGSAVLAGLILSAYRFDTVIKEPAEGVTSSDSGIPEDKRRKTQE